MERRASTPVYPDSVKLRRKIKKKAKNFPCDLCETPVTSVAKIWVSPQIIRIIRSARHPNARLCDKLLSQ
jgi:hypothetical protein